MNTVVKEKQNFFMEIIIILSNRSFPEPLPVCSVPYRQLRCLKNRLKHKNIPHKAKTI